MSRREACGDCLGADSGKPAKEEPKVQAPNKAGNPVRALARSKRAG